MLQKFGLHLVGKVLETCLDVSVRSPAFLEGHLVWNCLQARVSSVHNKMCEFCFQDVDVM